VPAVSPTHLLLLSSRARHSHTHSYLLARATGYALAMTRLRNVRTSRVAVIVLCSALVTGCDSLWKLQANVTVPGATQRAVGPYPQQLLLRAAMRDAPHRWSVHRLAVLCQPSDDPLVAPVVCSGVRPECSSIYDVEAWLAPVESANDLTCGPSPLYDGEILNPCDGVECAPASGQPFGSAVAFDDGCQREDTVTLNVVL
jgi:hypothetical protein